MRLYYSPSACSLSPHIVVRELGLEVEMEKVVFNADGTRTTEPHKENFYEVNPRGYVPAFKMDSGHVMTEGAAIVQYLADQKPETLSFKAGTPEHYEMLEWLTFISSEVHKGFSPTFRKDISEDEKTKAIDKLKTRFSWVEKHLEGKEYLVGGKFTIADAYLFTILRWHPRAGIDLAAYPHISAYYERIASRPMVAKAMEEEGITK